MNTTAPMTTVPTPLVDEAAEWLADGLARRLRVWAETVRPGAAGLDHLAAAARLASLDTSAGHVCADLSDWSAADREGLLASGLVGTPQQPDSAPLILDAEQRLYLRRYFDYERRLALALRQRGAATGLTPPSAAAIGRLNALFPPSTDAEIDWQKLAAASALLSRLTVISGGPGTGKTTTVLKLLACLLADDPDCRIALAAPTGKAAGRMVEALRGQAGRLTDEGLLPADLADKLPRQASTLHRLLGYQPQGGFRHHAGNPLPVDVLVVDEASMLDLALAAKLVDAVPAGARLILLGDKDQLAAVEAGAVFAEIAGDPRLSPARRVELSRLTGFSVEAIEPLAPLRETPLRDAVIWFTRNYRFHKAPGIGHLAELANAGDDAGAVAWLRGQETCNVEWLDDAGTGVSASLREQVLAGYEAYFAALPPPGSGQPDDETLQAVFAAFNRFRVLCAVREGPRGIGALNRLVTETVLRRQGQALSGPDAEGFIGRPVLVLRNDYASRLFNGDIGLMLPGGEAGELMVYFPEGESSFRAVPRVRLPEHDTAFAMTVHKSQGSEFDRVALILPAAISRVVTRELIYTGITRARASVLLASAEAVLAEGIRRRTDRRSGLLARLAESEPAE
jgi:exodeoxyribonuclease V alpha subunit